jgi:hypothetical protein
LIPTREHIKPPGQRIKPPSARQASALAQIGVWSGSLGSGALRPLRAVAKVTTEADRSVGADRPAAIENVSDPAGRHANIEGEPVGAQAPRSQFAFQQTARVNGRRHCSHPLW